MDWKLKTLLYLAIVFAIVIICTAAFAQEKTPSTEKQAPAVPQELPKNVQNEILKIQLKQAPLQGEYDKAAQRLKDIPAEFQQLQKQIQDKLDAALLAMQLNPKEYVVDLSTFKITKKPEEPKPAEPKKP